jgi:predicted membrane protein
MSNNRGSQGRIFWGLVLIAVGVLFLLDQMDEVDFGYLFSRYWPVIFILIGLSIIIGNGFKNVGAGIFFILFGVFFQLVRLDLLGHRAWDYFWPSLIILAGLLILLRPGHHDEDKKKIPDVTVDELRISQVFSGTSRRVESASFKGGTAEVVFGSAEIDMTGAKLDGGQATISLSVVLGSIELRVPSDWQVIVHGTPVLGSVEHKAKAVSDTEKKATLYLKTSVVLGSITIKS